MKKKALFFCCALCTTLLVLTGCVVNPPVDSGPSKKTLLPSSAIQVIQSADRLRVIAYSDVCFRPNGKLTTRCAHQLSQTIKLVKSYGSGLIQVVGYSDDLYDSQTASTITEEQAEVITNFLWLHGIGSQRLRTMGYGGRDFIASNRNVKESSFNRRVEIILVKNNPLIKP